MILVGTGRVSVRLFINLYVRFWDVFCGELLLFHVHFFDSTFLASV